MDSPLITILLVDDPLGNVPNALTGCNKYTSIYIAIIHLLLTEIINIHARTRYVHDINVNIVPPEEYSSDE